MRFGECPCRKKLALSGMGANTSITDALVKLFGGVQGAVTGAQTGLQDASDQLKQAIEVQLALSAVTAIAVVALVAITLGKKGR